MWARYNGDTSKDKSLRALTQFNSSSGHVIATMMFQHVGTASCDGNTLYYNCSSCPNIDKRTNKQGCNGNCKWNESNGMCEARGK